MSWFETARRAAEPVYQEILRLPFIQELIAGTLPREKFIFYLQQDSHYLKNYMQVLAHIASRVPGVEMTDLFLGFAKDCVAVETGMHASFLRNAGAVPAMSQACLLYTSVQRAQALGDVAIEAASVLPCFKVYLDAGLYIFDKAKPLAGNPYEEWIATYSDTSFAEATEKAIAACDALAEQASPSVRSAMTDIYVLCTRMEHLFWHSAYHLGQADW